MRSGPSRPAPLELYDRSARQCVIPFNRRRLLDEAPTSDAKGPPLKSSVNMASAIARVHFGYPAPGSSPLNFKNRSMAGVAGQILRHRSLWYESLDGTAREENHP